MKARTLASIVATTLLCIASTALLCGCVSKPVPAAAGEVLVPMTQHEAEWWAFFKTTKAYAMQVLGQPFECDWGLE